MSTKQPFFGLLKRLFDVKPEETPTALLLFLYFFLITASAYIIIPVKISLSAMADLRKTALCLFAHGSFDRIRGHIQCKAFTHAQKRAVRHIFSTLLCGKSIHVLVSF